MILYTYIHIIIYACIYTYIFDIHIIICVLSRRSRPSKQLCDHAKNMVCWCISCETKCNKTIGWLCPWRSWNRALHSPTILKDFRFVFWLCRGNWGVEPHDWFMMGEFMGDKSQSKPRRKAVAKPGHLLVGISCPYQVGWRSYETAAWGWPNTFYPNTKCGAQRRWTHSQSFDWHTWMDRGGNHRPLWLFHSSIVIVLYSGYNSFNH